MRAQNKVTVKPYFKSPIDYHPVCVPVLEIYKPCKHKEWILARGSGGYKNIWIKTKAADPDRNIHQNEVLCMCIFHIQALKFCIQVK